MTGTADDDFRRAALVTRADMEAELKRLHQERENDRRMGAPVPKLAPKGPGGAAQHGADSEKFAAVQSRTHKRELRIRYLEMCLHKPSGKSRGRSRKL